VTDSAAGSGKPRMTGHASASKLPKIPAQANS
jgi:hypothetical protein